MKHDYALKVWRHSIWILLTTLNELSAERVAGGAKPSKTDTAAPTSGSDKEAVWTGTKNKRWQFTPKKFKLRASCWKLKSINTFSLLRINEILNYPCSRNIRSDLLNSKIQTWPCLHELYDRHNQQVDTKIIWIKNYFHYKIIIKCRLNLVYPII